MKKYALLMICLFSTGVAHEAAPNYKQCPCGCECAASCDCGCVHGQRCYCGEVAAPQK